MPSTSGPSNSGFPPFGSAPWAPDAFFSSAAKAGGEFAQHWMRILAGASGPEAPAAWLAAHCVNPAHAAQLHAEYLEGLTHVWSGLAQGAHAGADAKAGAAEDRRFVDSQWRDDPWFVALKGAYLLGERYLAGLADAVKAEGQEKERIRFAVKQWSDAMCPTNFIATNPVAIREAMRTQGESLSRGIVHLLEDVARGRLSQSDESAFELGRNLATTPGQVVFENRLIQLIQYAPTTPHVARRPLVIVPPCINKYYILDLQPENSFVRFAVAQGYTVFVLSWRNPGLDLGHLGWDDYLEEGVFTSLRTARVIAGSDRVNVLGYCVGGTLLGAALAVLAARGEDSVASATWLTTLLDFSETGQLGLFVDESVVAGYEATIGHGGILPGAMLANVFSALRANDLVWPYVVNNYLMGGKPQAFDLLYWNADGTNLPGPMFCAYLRNTYLENRLRRPGAMTACGVPVDLRRIACPNFVIAAREDHIVPWRAAYRSLALLGGEKTFLLGASGHVAGIVNPPEAKRRSYWTGGPYPDDAQAWFSQAREHSGSWWPEWARWLARYRGGEREAPARTGDARHAPIEPAPGRYVRERAPQPFSAFAEEAVGAAAKTTPSAPLQPVPSATEATRDVRRRPAAPYRPRKAASAKMRRTVRKTPRRRGRV